jgi:hypothetical protein
MDVLEREFADPNSHDFARAVERNLVRTRMNDVRKIGRWALFILLAILNSVRLFEAHYGHQETIWDLLIYILFGAYILLEIFCWYRLRRIKRGEGRILN